VVSGARLVGAAVFSGAAADEDARIEGEAKASVTNHVARAGECIGALCR
jgi:hypothetical protein